MNELTKEEEIARDEFHAKSYLEWKLEDIKAQHAYFKEHSVARPTHCPPPETDEHWFNRGDDLSRTNDHVGLTSFIAESDYKKRVKRLRWCVLKCGVFPQRIWDARSSWQEKNRQYSIQECDVSSWAKTILDDYLMKKFSKDYCYL